jgi:uncharacterized protein (UPF0548 family)
LARDSIVRVATHRWSRELARLASVPLSYEQVGATRSVMPAGYRETVVERTLGTGQACFQAAAKRLMTWEMHRRAGLMVVAEPRVSAGSVAVLRVRVGLWWIDAPVRVVDVVDEPAVFGFTYGTLPGHPEEGEERFFVRRDANETVRAEIRAFSRPGRILTKIGGPMARRIQDRLTERYLDALADDAPFDA